MLIELEEGDFMSKKIVDLTYAETVDKIIEINEHIRDFWSKAGGWAPAESVALLSEARLDWLASLSYSLVKWSEEPIHGAEAGDLILAWSNLGALVEGAMKFFLSVHYLDYEKDAAPILRSNKKVEPDVARFNDLRMFFYRRIWNSSNREEKNSWVQEIQNNRNSIHAYHNRDIKDFDVFRQQVKEYYFFLVDLLRRIPYPDDVAGPNYDM